MADDYTTNPTLGGIPSQPMTPGTTLGYNPYMSIYGGGRESSLSDPGTQQKAHDVLNKALDSQLDDMRKGNREQTITDIFGKLVGPAMAAFGGLGTGQGGLQLMQEAENERNKHRADNAQKLSNTASLMNSVTNFVDRTSPDSQKALAAQFAAANNQQKTNIATDKENRMWTALGVKKDQFKMNQDRLTKNQNDLTAQRKIMNAQGQQRIDFLKQNAQAQLKLKESIEARARELQEKGIDLAHDDRLLAMKLGWAHLEQAEKLGLAHHNMEVQKLKSEPMDPKDPSKGLKYAGIPLEPLQASSYNFNAGSEPDEVMNDPTIQAGFAASDALIQGLQPQQQTAGAGQPPADGAAPQQPGAAQTSPTQPGQFSTPQEKLHAIMNDPNLPADYKAKASAAFIAKYKQSQVAANGQP